MLFDAFSACFASKKVQYRKEPFKEPEIYDCHEHSSGTHSPCATACARHADAAARAGNACPPCSAAHPGSARNVCAPRGPGCSGAAHADAHEPGCSSHAAASRCADAPAWGSPGFPSPACTWGSCDAGLSRGVSSPAGSDSSGGSGGTLRHGSPGASCCSQTGGAGDWWVGPEGKRSRSVQDFFHHCHACGYRADWQAFCLRQHEEGNLTEVFGNHQTCGTFAPDCD